VVSGGVLPTGLALNAASGVLAGTLTAAGGFSFTITASDANGCPVTMTYAVTVAAVPPTCPTVTLGPGTLPPGTTGLPYSQTLSGSGGVAPYTFNVSSGALPSGLTLNPGTGALTGVPAAAGIFNISVTATDANGCAGVANYTVNIAVAPAVTSIPTLSDRGLLVLIALMALMGLAMALVLRKR
jgi:large repetitive protein